MQSAKIRIWLLSIGGAVVSLFLLFYGIKILFHPNDISAQELFILGIGSVLSGVFVLASQMYIPRKFSISTILILLGVYFFARASGVIEIAWIWRLLGLGSLIGSGLIIYVTYLGGKKIH